MKPEFVGGPFRLNWLIYAVLTWLGIVAVMAIFAGIATKALSQEMQEPQCGPYTEWEKQLAKQAGQTEVSFALLDSQRFIAVFASPHGETWTMLAVGISGKACLMMTGTDYYQIAVIKKGEAA